MRVRHVIAASGRLPQDPAREPASGVVGAVLGLAVPQVSEGYSVGVWGWNDLHSAQRVTWKGIKMWMSPEWAWARFASWDVRWLAPVWWHGLTQAAVDVLHTHVDPNLLYLPGARVRLLHLHTPVPNPFPPAYQRLLRRADAVICCSEFIRTQFLSTADYPAERTFVVYNGADLSTYPPGQGRTQRAEWRFSDDDVVILYAGAIVPEKGVAQLVRAFAQVQASVPQARLVIVGASGLWAMPGGNPAGEAYEAEVRRQTDPLNVRFLGSLPRSQMPAAYLAADVVAVPSVWDEPLGTVVCEAMAAGRPVVASRAGGITETVIPNRTGILVAPGNEEQLAEALTTLVADPELRRQMGEAARERAKTFSWEVSARRLDSIYHQLLRTREEYQWQDNPRKAMGETDD